jgi:hypothetical protein
LDDAQIVLANRVTACDKESSARETTMGLTGHSFRTAIFKSVVGNIEVEKEVCKDVTIRTSIWVVFPDGFGDEISTVQEGLDKL